MIVRKVDRNSSFAGALKSDYEAIFPSVNFDDVTHIATTQWSTYRGDEVEPRYGYAECDEYHTFNSITALMEGEYELLGVAILSAKDLFELTKDIPNSMLIPVGAQFLNARAIALFKRKDV